MHTVKGKAQPLALYRVLAERPDAGKRGLPGLTSPLVGREGEMDTLLGCLEELDLGRGQIVLLIGEPGLGKTRLLRELRQGALVGAPRWIIGRCAPYGANAAHALLADLLRSALDLTPLDPEGAVRLRLRAALERLLGGEGRAVLPYALALLGLAPEPEMIEQMAQLNPQALLQHTFQAMRTLLERQVAATPTILVLEDTHWVDATSLEFLSEHILDLPDSMPLLVLLTFRPDPQAPSWRLRAKVLTEYRHRAREVILGPLSAQQSHALIGNLLTTTGLPTGITDAILGKAEGNPFFVEEVLRSLIDQGILRQTGDGWICDVASAEIDVPETIEGVLLSRIDALDVESKRVLQVASVIGRTFSARLLSWVLEEPDTLGRQLVALQAMELIRERGRIPEAIYTFRHALTRDAAYNTLPSGQRALYHERVGAALEALYPDSLDERLDLLTYHYSRGRDQDKAVHYLRQAADRALALYANETARIYYHDLTHRLDTLGRTAESAAIREQGGEILGRLARFDEAFAVLERAAETYKAAGDTQGLGRTVARIGRIHAYRGTPHAGIARITAVLADLAGGAPSAALAALYVALGRLYFVTGRYQEQLQVAEQAATVARAVGDPGVLAEAEMRRGTALAHLGRREEGLHVLEEAIPLAEAAGDLGTLSRSLSNAAGIYAIQGDLVQSGLYFERGLQATERLGDPARIAYMTSRSGWHAFICGDWARAREYLERAVTMVQRIGASWVTAHPLGNLAELRLAEGNWDTAAALLQDAVGMAQRSHDTSELHEARRQLAHIDLLQGRADAACAVLDELAMSKDAEEDAPILLPLRAWAHLETGDGAGAVGFANDAVARATAEQNVLALVDALRIQGMVVAHQGQWEAAEQAYTEALSLAQRIGYPHGEALVQHAYGLLKARTGAPVQARERLEAARAIFARLGAARRLTEVSAVLGALDPPP
jgi:tetratricopeptide (TPR) repeat protein